MLTKKPYALSVWTLFLCLGFLFLGIVENFRTTFMPLMSSELALSETQLSGLIVMSAIASIILQVSAGYWSEKISTPRLYIITFAILAAILFISTLITNYVRLLTFYFIIQLGVTLYLLVSNSLIPTLGARSTQLLTFSHGCYGLGAACSPLIAEKLLDLTGNWQMSYQVIAYPGIFMCLFILYLSRPRLSLSMPTHSQTHIKPSLPQLLSKPLVWWFILLFGTGITTEVATANWFVYYLCSTENLSQGDAAGYLSIFYILFTCGRFIGSFTLVAGSEASVLRKTLLLTTALIICTVGFPQWSSIFLTLSGITVALIFPMMLMILNQSFSAHHTYILGVVVSGALMIFIGVNALIGVWSEFLSVRTSYCLMAGCGCIAFGSSMVISRTYSLKVNN